MSQIALSAHFSAADLCCAGETWERTRIVNEPKQVDSWQALRTLCAIALEPVLMRFGRPEITYGFASPELLRLIPAHKAPALDQHAACELNARAKPICARRGAAVDFRVDKVSARDLAIWIAETLPFDRLYFYGSDRPLHVSMGPDQAGSIVAMLPSPSGRRVPRQSSIAWLKAVAA
jgi:hypothetical protein